MTSASRGFATLLVAAVLSLACGTDGAPLEEDGAPEVEAETIDGPAADAAPDDPGAEVAPVEGEVILGVNPQGENKPAFFSPLPAGADLAIEVGPQGLNMVVLAFKTRGIFTGPVSVLATLTSGGAELGTLQLANQKLHLGAEGWSYYYNLFLVVFGEGHDGQPGDVHLELTDDAGHHVVIDRGVVLRGP